MKPLLWMRTVRDLGELPAARLAVLFCLALRMDKDGRGYASQRQLAADANMDERTVRRHLAWAREVGLLEQTRRGHRVKTGSAVASEWQLTQPDTGDLLGTDPTGQNERPNRTAGTTQPDTGVRPRGLPQEVYPPERAAAPLGAARAAGATGGRPDDMREWTEQHWIEWGVDDRRFHQLPDEPHQHEKNAYRALKTLCDERRLPFYDIDTLVSLAYICDPDPWNGYLTVKAATEQSFDGAKDLVRVLCHRLKQHGVPAHNIDKWLKQWFADD